jgi:hypothetical protein
LLRSIIMAAIVTACASPGQVIQPACLPESTEVEAYVRLHWNEFSRRVAFAASRQGEKPSLQGFRDADCGHRFGLPDLLECSFYVTAEFNDGYKREQWLSTQFRRDEDGGLVETFEMVHPIRS